MLLSWVVTPCWTLFPVLHSASLLMSVRHGRVCLLIADS